MICAGIETYDQKINIIENRAIISYQLNKKDPMKKGFFCENDEWTLKNDPRNYTFLEGEENFFLNRTNEGRTSLAQIAAPQLSQVLEGFVLNRFWLGKYLPS